MTWVEKYLCKTYNKWKVQKIMDDVDHRIAAVALFSGLQQFPQGHGFKQWTGDDSRALMKVYLLAIEGHVPQDVIHTFHVLLDFCYLVCRNIITEDSLLQIEDTLSHFHHYCKIFRTMGVNKHIKAVKEPWRQSSHFNALDQILLTNQWLDKLSALRVDFVHRGMLTGTCLSAANALCKSHISYEISFN
ncbi:hypothetical protein BDR04DRAFT_1129373 [Suillus decipiens]|nr:hypothetical protein BDR04DRAFT_1129373 [Suillus decipiens]